MPAVIFFDETTGESLSLESRADLPAAPIGFGAELEKQITSYGARNARSVQIVGVNFAPIELSGKWSGRQQGDRTRPRALASAFEALAAKARILRIEWGPYQRWGLLDFYADHTLDDEIAFKITFTVLYDKPPASLSPPAFRLAPGDSLSLATDQGDKLDELLYDSPAWALGGFVAQLVNARGSINNALANAQSLLSNAASYADVSRDTLQLAASSVALALAGSSRLVDRALAASEDTAAAAGSTGAQGQAVVRWAGEVELEGRRLRLALSDLLRAISGAISPPANRRHVLRDGETLYTLAYLYFYDLSAWEAIADANGLDTPIVAAGVELLIPDRLEFA